MFTRKQRWRRVRVMRFSPSDYPGECPKTVHTSTNTPWHVFRPGPARLCQGGGDVGNLGRPGSDQRHRESVCRHRSSSSADGVQQTPASRSPYAAHLCADLLGFLFFSSGGSRAGRRARAATEGCGTFAPTTMSQRPRRLSESGLATSGQQRSRVRFSQQIRVILVASRMEMLPVKADVWWGERDYYAFRHAYLTMGETPASPDEQLVPRKRRAKQEGVLLEDTALVATSPNETAGVDVAPRAPDIDYSAMREAASSGGGSDSPPSYAPATRRRPAQMPPLPPSPPPPPSPSTPDADSASRRQSLRGSPRERGRSDAEPVPKQGFSGGILRGATPALIQPASELDALSSDCHEPTDATRVQTEAAECRVSSEHDGRECEAPGTETPAESMAYRREADKQGKSLVRGEMFRCTPTRAEAERGRGVQDTRSAQSSTQDLPKPTLDAATTAGCVGDAMRTGHDVQDDKIKCSTHHLNRRHSAAPTHLYPAAPIHRVASL